MGKLTDYIDDKRAKEENINSHNIIKNDSAFQRFIENIEDLDFEDFNNRIEWINKNC